MKLLTFHIILIVLFNSDRCEVNGNVSHCALYDAFGLYAIYCIICYIMSASQLHFKIKSDVKIILHTYKCSTF